MFYQTAYRFIEDQTEHNLKYILRSPKSCVLAAILSLFLGLFGAQNLYLGHFRRTFLALAVDIFSIVFFLISLSNPAFLFVWRFCLLYLPHHDPSARSEYIAQWLFLDLS